jgi:DNA-binding response OmpR family regulator
MDTERKYRILVSEDDEDIVALLQRFLTLQGFEVFGANDGNTTLRTLAENNIDVILCDWRLPDIDGVTLLSKIKEKYPEIQFIMITSYTDIKLAVEVIKMGAFDYITKPLIPNEIVKEIKAAIKLKEEKTEMAKAKLHKSREVFISYNWKDKAIARKFADKLKDNNIAVWIDEGEIKLGDSLIQKIKDGLDQVRYVLALISENSIESGWVKRELEIAINHEIASKRVKVLPIVIGDVQPPEFLLGKMYAKLNRRSSKGVSDIVDMIQKRLLDDE